eukprot:365964-Chlamydomonas_euryale.AAC.6
MLPFCFHAPVSTTRSIPALPHDPEASHAKLVKQLQQRLVDPSPPTTAPLLSPKRATPASPRDPEASHAKLVKQLKLRLVDPSPPTTAPLLSPERATPASPRDPEASHAKPVKQLQQRQLVAALHVDLESLGKAALHRTLKHVLRRQRQFVWRLQGLGCEV